MVETSGRAEVIFQQHQLQIYRRTDRMFALLMAIQYFAGIAAALWISPRTWSGAESSVHAHVWAAAGLGGLILSLPIVFALLLPGRTITRHVIAVGQMLDSALLIHLAGGRIETHFHIFGSLAFLGFYRDWRVLITASTVVGLDHFFRGLYWPQSVFGLMSTQSWRWLEHVGWVVFEDIFLILACYQSRQEMREIAERRAYVEKVAQERAQNISELHQLRDELKLALQAKDTFISICSHEIKTPLTSLSLQTELMQRAMAQGGVSPERINKLLRQTDSQVRRLLRLVQDMLDHSRIQMGRLEIRPEPVELGALVREVVERCQGQADSNATPLWLEAASVNGCWDAGRIEQVVTNLVTNAIKYGSGHPVEITVKQEGERALVLVRDHGPGVPENERERIFEKFERGSSTLHIPGVGLGLFISRAIVERHGGRLAVATAPGGGSVFTMELPLQGASHG